jgi:hypothetical protein
MAESPFHVGTEFAKRAVVFQDFKKRVVTEAVMAAWYQPNPSAASAESISADCPTRVSYRDVTDISGSSPLDGSLRQLVQKPPIILFVGRAGPGISG